MVDYWFDTDSFITPSRGPYRFSRGTQLWDFLEKKAHEKVIGSPEIVLTMELTGSDPKKADDLEKWAKQLKGTLFLPPDKYVQDYYSQIVETVNLNEQYKIYEIQSFLKGADPWVIAYAMTYGGKIVTFENSKPLSKKPKIPDVAALFGLSCINLWDALDELKFKI